MAGLARARYRRADSVGGADPRGTRVAFVRDGERDVGTVAASHGDEVTIRVHIASGDRFPTLSRVDVEPVTEVSAIAAAQALAAQRAGRPSFAAAWTVRAAALP